MRAIKVVMATVIVAIGLFGVGTAMGADEERSHRVHRSSTPNDGRRYQARCCWILKWSLCSTSCSRE